MFCLIKDINPAEGEYGLIKKWSSLLFAGLMAACSLPQPMSPSESSNQTSMVAPSQDQTEKRSQLRLQEITFADLPGWPSADDLHDFVPAFLKSCNRFAPQPINRPIGGAGLPGVMQDWRSSCEALAQAQATDPQLRQPDRLRATLEAYFVPFAASNQSAVSESDLGLFTGYYEPLLYGAQRPSPQFFYPLYRLPPDLVTVDLGQFRPELANDKIVGQIKNNKIIPYATRKDIDAGILNGKGLELLWVDDPTAAFFLHVQGSGRVVLPDGQQIRLSYAGRNGHPYASIGRELVRRGALTLDQASMQSIRAWIEDHPDQAWDLFAHNPSYIFFKILEKAGPIGAQGAVLTPERSLAIDQRFIPFGVPIWIDLPNPKPVGGNWQRLMVAQDTGGAIRGPVRGDFFWGHGPKAEQGAGTMKVRGRYFIFLPRTVAVRMRSTS